MDLIQRTKLEALIVEYVNGRNCERNRNILRTRFFQGYSFEKIAGIFDMSTIQIGRIIHRYGDPLLIMLSKME